MLIVKQAFLGIFILVILMFVTYSEGTTNDKIIKAASCCMSCSQRPGLCAGGKFNARLPEPSAECIIKS
jgi:hypothetical protein